MAFRSSLPSETIEQILTKLATGGGNSQRHSKLEY